MFAWYGGLAARSPVRYTVKWEMERGVGSRATAEIVPLTIAVQCGGRSCRGREQGFLGGLVAVGLGAGLDQGAAEGDQAGRCPASTAYLSHVLGDCGYPPRMIRSTRLVGLVNTMDPKLVAAAFGMDPQATLIYLADHVDPGRLPDHDKSS